MNSDSGQKKTTVKERDNVTFSYEYTCCKNELFEIYKQGRIYLASFGQGQFCEMLTVNMWTY